MLIQIQDLSFTYAPGTPLEKTALRGIGLEFQPGERIGLLGPTGSGKSTLAQLIAGLLRPTGGRVLLDGVAAHRRGADARSRRQRVGMAFQYPEHQIFEQTVFDEVAFGARHLGVRGAELEERVGWALGIVGLDPAEVSGRNPLSQSGGEMRRLALASILVRKPEVLILDEPTANLDPRGRQDLLTRLLAWHRQANLTLIIISHNLDDLGRIAERTVLLVDGRVDADGPVRSVLSDAPLLQSAGFRVPKPVALLQALQQGGMRLRTDRLLPSEAAAEIARVAAAGGRVA